MSSASAPFFESKGGSFRTTIDVDEATGIVRRVEYAFEGGFSIAIVQRRFEAGSHVSSKTWEVIDGRKAWGVLLEKPSTETEAVVVLVGGHSYSLNVQDLYDMWTSAKAAYIDRTGSLDTYLRLVCSDADTCTLTGTFSGEVSAYNVEWVIENGTSRRVRVYSPA